MVYLAIKNGEVVHHTSLDAMRRIDGVHEPALSITDKQYADAEGILRVIDGAIFVGKTDAEKAADAARAELDAIKADIASRDYRALKAQKLGQPLDSLYPGESAWYAGRLARMEELEEVIAAAA